MLALLFLFHCSSRSLREGKLAVSVFRSPRLIVYPQVLPRSGYGGKDGIRSPVLFEHLITSFASNSVSYLFAMSGILPVECPAPTVAYVLVNCFPYVRNDAVSH